MPDGEPQPHVPQEVTRRNFVKGLIVGAGATLGAGQLLTNWSSRIDKARQNAEPKEIQTHKNILSRNILDSLARNPQEIQELPRTILSFGATQEFNNYLDDHSKSTAKILTTTDGNQMVLLSLDVGDFTKYNLPGDSLRLRWNTDNGGSGIPERDTSWTLPIRDVIKILNEQNNGLAEENHRLNLAITNKKIDGTDYENVFVTPVKIDPHNSKNFVQVELASPTLVLENNGSYKTADLGTSLTEAWFLPRGGGIPS